jgi:diadenosine tetraphosphate (Ap4A) HIT family hydrolase
MSINPLQRGHTLVVPIEEVDHWIDASPELNGHLLAVAQRIGAAQQTVFAPERVGLIIAGLEVPHLHIHVIPIQTEADLDFANAAASVDPADLEAAAGQIRSQLA